MIDKLVEMNLGHPVTSRVQYARRGEAEAEGGRMDLRFTSLFSMDAT